MHTHTLAQTNAPSTADTRTLIPLTGLKENLISSLC